MPLELTIALIVISAIYLILIFRAIKKGKMQISFSIFWILSGFGLIIALIIPDLISKISRTLGFSVPSNMMFCVTIFIAFLLIFDLTVKLSKESKRNILLVQEISLLKNRVEKLENGEKNEKV